MKQKLLSYVMLFAFVYSLVFTTPAFADGPDQEPPAPAESLDPAEVLQAIESISIDSAAEQPATSDPTVEPIITEEPIVQSSAATVEEESAIQPAIESVVIVPSSTPSPEEILGLEESTQPEAQSIEQGEIAEVNVEMPEGQSAEVQVEMVESQCHDDETVCLPNPDVTEITVDILVNDEAEAALEEIIADAENGTPIEDFEIEVEASRRYEVEVGDYVTIYNGRTGSTIIAVVTDCRLGIYISVDPLVVVSSDGEVIEEASIHQDESFLDISVPDGETVTVTIDIPGRHEDPVTIMVTGICQICSVVTQTATNTAMPTATATITATNTSTPTTVPTTGTPESTITATPTITVTNTSTPTLEPSPTETIVPTVAPTQTPVITPTTQVIEEKGEKEKEESNILPAGKCTEMEPIIYEKDGDIYSLESTSDTTPTNMTLGFKYPVSNPDGKECKYTAEAERDGQKDIALFNTGGFVRWLTDSEGDDQSPTWNQRGNINYSDATGQMHEVDAYGNDVSKDLGFGTNPVNANNNSHFAYQSTAGNLIIDGEEFVAHGVPLNFDWMEPILYYRSDETGQVMMLNYETSEVTRSESGANDIAPNPSVTFDGLVSIENSDKILKLNLLSPITVGCQQDWWRASK